MRHGEVTRQMFPSHPINAITYGVHTATWTAPSTVQLFDGVVPEWRHDNL
jgi:starch phosphorylase